MKTTTLRFDVEGFDGGIESIRTGDRIEITYQGMPVMSFLAYDLNGRDWTIASLLEAGLKGILVAQLCHTSRAQVSAVRKLMRMGGTEALTHPQRGRNKKITGKKLEEIRQLRRKAMSLEKIAEKFEVSITTVFRATKDMKIKIDENRQTEFEGMDELSKRDERDAGEKVEKDKDQSISSNRDKVSRPFFKDDEELFAGEPLPSGPVEHPCRYAGTLLICAAVQALGLFTAMQKGGVNRPEKAVYNARQAVLALLAAWASGYGSLEAMHERDACALGVVLGLERSPSVRTLHRAIAEMIMRFNPIAFCAQLLEGLIGAFGKVSRIFGIDGHFKAYFGKEPIDKGYDTKRRIAQKGICDVLVHDEQGRLLLGIEVEAGARLSEYLLSMASQLKAGLDETEQVLLGFDRGGFCFDTLNELHREGFCYVAWVPETVYMPELSTIAPDEDGVGEHLWNHKSLEKGHQARLLVQRDGMELVPAVTNLPQTVSAQESLELLRKIRGIQENDIKAARRFAHIDRLVDRGGAKRAPDDRLVTNPVHEELSKKQKAIRVRLDEIIRQNPIGKKDKALHEGEHMLAEFEMALVKYQLKDVPSKVPRTELLPEAERAWLKTKNRSLLQPLKYLLANSRRFLLSALLEALAPSDSQLDQSAMNRTLEALIRAPGTVRFGAQEVEVIVDLQLPPQPHSRLDKGLAELSARELYFSDGQRRIIFRLAPRPTRQTLPSANLR